MKRLEPYLVLLGSAIDHLYLGCFYLWGNIAPYINSYLYYEVGTWVNANSTLAAIPLQALAMGMFNPVGAFL